MRILVLIIPLSLCVALLSLTAYGRNTDDRYRAIEKELEDAESAYWKAKYRLIEIKQTSREELEKLDDEARELMKRRDSLKEEILSVKADNRDLSRQEEDLELRLSEINSSFLNTIDKLTVYAKRNRPFTSDQDIAALNKLRQNVEERASVISISRDIVRYISRLLDDSRRCSVRHTELLTGEKIPASGKKVRLGNIFYGYVTDDSSDAGILLRAGRVAKREFKWHSDPGLVEKALERFIILLKGKEELATLPLDVMQSRAVGKAYREGGSALGGFAEWFKSGGVVMYGILIILAYAIYIVAERIILFRRNRVNADHIMEPILQTAEARNFKEVRRLCETADGPLPRMLSEIFDDTSISREEAFNKMQEVILHEVPVIEKHIPTLKSLGALAPLLGLLGTVTGMISLFDVITSFGTGDPKLLAGGIAEALVTTEFGLIVAIPALLVYRILMNVAERIINDLERYSATVLNRFWKAG